VNDHESLARRDAVCNGLLPIVRIEGEPLRWRLDDRLAHHGCPGTAIAVMRGGRIDWVDGFGRRETAGPDTVGPDTVFMVASCSKPVTATLVLQQVERGVLDLDADISTYLRRWQLPPGAHDAEHPVTLRGVLSHTAGLTVNGWGATPQDGSPVPGWLDLLEGRPPSQMPPVVVDVPPGGPNRYSGGGYLLAQLALEDVLGVPFADLADEMLFTPLGMTRSSFRRPLEEHLRDDVASGHGDDGRAHAGGWMLAAEMAAGGLYSTARDYATFLLALRDAYHGAPGAVLGQTLAREMTTAQRNGTFGLGPRVLPTGDDVRINHGGSNDGYQSETDLFLGSGDGAVVFTNATSGIYLYREILNGIAEVYDWPGYLLPPKRVRQLGPADLARYVGEFRIEAGIELPRIRVWVEDGRLFSEVPGLRFGAQETFCDEDGVLFQQTGPFETHVVFGDDGNADEFVVREGAVLVLRARRET
jgi:CubicO group peptidase (beta-lactamase class C family)